MSSGSADHAIIRCNGVDDNSIEIQTAVGVTPTSTSVTDTSHSESSTSQPPAPRVRIRGWPTLLHKLVSEEEDDEWKSVISHIRQHPEEVGKYGMAFKMTPLHQICYRQPSLEVVQLMIRSCPGLASLQNVDGETPLHIAASSCPENIQKVLLEDSPEATTKVDKYGDSPLLLVVGVGPSVAFLEQMLQSGDGSCVKMIHLPNQINVTAFSSLGQSYIDAENRDDIDSSKGGQYADDWKRAMLCIYHSALHAGIISKQQVPSFGDPYSPYLTSFSSFNPLHLASRMNAPLVLIETMCRLFPEWTTQRDEQNGLTPLCYAVLAPLWIEVKAPVFDTFDEVDQDDDFDPVWSDEDIDGGGKMPAEKDHFDPCAIDVMINKLSALIPDKNGRLPLALALEAGRDLDEGPRSIILANPQVLDIRDDLTLMYPFMIAAAANETASFKEFKKDLIYVDSPFVKEHPDGVNKRPSLDTVYELIRALPELIAMGITQTSTNSHLRSNSSKGIAQESERSTRIDDLNYSDSSGKVISMSTSQLKRKRSF